MRALSVSLNVVSVGSFTCFDEVDLQRKTGAFHEQQVSCPRPTCRNRHRNRSDGRSNSPRPLSKTGCPRNHASARRCPQRRHQGRTWQSTVLLFPRCGLEVTDFRLAALRLSHYTLLPIAPNARCKFSDCLIDYAAVLVGSDFSHANASVRNIRVRLPSLCTLSRPLLISS